MAAPDLEREREALLSQVQRYPQMLTADQWTELQRMAREGDTDGQLLLLRGAVGPMIIGRPAAAARHEPDGRRDALILELTDRLATAERRAGAAEADVRTLRAENDRLKGSR